MFKICTIVGTRPEIIKLSSLIKKLDKFFDQNIIHTGQNYDYELNQIFFKDLKIRKPDYFLHETDKWLVFPHELEGLSAKEIIENKPELKELLDKLTPKL